VLFFHGNHLAGGYLGVDLFFVLSGFLITSLLLAESGSTGHVGLAHFWERRARRLLPALLVMLLGVAAYARFAAQRSELHRIRMDGLATAFYVANWRDVFAHADYWSLFSTPSPLDHTWSLAIEEQFYLLWPLLFVALLALLHRRGRRTDASDGRNPLPMLVLGVAVGLAAVSVVLSQVLYRSSGSNRVYYGTDTRAFAILAGVALAAVTTRFGPVRSRTWRVLLEVAGCLAVVVLAVAWVRLDGNSPTLYRGGLLLCSVAAAVAIAAAVQPTRGPVAYAASFKPLVWLGLISYGVYLYHWPIFVWLNADRTGLDGWSLFAVQLAVTLVVAVLSYRFIEQPIRHGSGWRPRTKVLAPSVGLASVALVVLVATTGYRPVMTNVALGRRIDAALARERAQPTDTRVLVVGNSVAWYLAHDGFAPLQDPLHMTVLNVAEPACSFPDITSSKLPDGTITTLTAHTCTRDWSQALASFKPDVVVFARNGISDDPLSHGGPFLTPCSEAYDTWYRDGLAKAARQLTAGGAHLVLVTSAYSPKRAYISDYGAVLRGTDCGNRAEFDVAATTPRVTVADLNRQLCVPDGACAKQRSGVTLRPDGTHFVGPGAMLVTRMLAPAVGVGTGTPR
jgi:peptidoglycan/LPS O-acetylase OafA/YrhL